MAPSADALSNDSRHTAGPVVKVAQHARQDPDPPGRTPHHDDHPEDQALITLVMLAAAGFIGWWISLAVQAPSEVHPYEQVRFPTMPHNSQPELRGGL